MPKDYIDFALMVAKILKVLIVPSKSNLQDNLLRSLKPLLALVEDLDTGDLPGKVWISGYLHPQDA
jgi:hypothetical protein